MTPPTRAVTSPAQTPRIGELFSGYGGLGMGVQSVYGGTIAWHSDIDKGACKILAHRYPDVPNLGDITTVDWSTVEPVDILTGGSPCQDLSHAGRRAGMSEGTRSNLWVAMREAIAQLRPAVVVWENVRGAYSAAADSEVEPCAGCVGDGSGVHLRALGRVLGDLSDLGYDCRWHGLRAADVGAPHGRFRVFVVATDRQSDAGRIAHRDGGPTAADAERGGWDGWSSEQIGRQVERVATAGMGEGHRFPWSEDAICAPADTADLGHERSGRAWDGRAGSANGSLMPTPRASDGTKGGPNQRGSSGDLMLSSAVALLPTPTVADAKASGSAGYGGNEFCTLTDAAVRGKGGMLLPTPMVGSSSEASHGQISGQYRDAMTDALSRWGDYADAIARWESVLGRPAPAPTMTSSKGNPQLAPVFVEWLMGLPAGWVDHVPGLTRNEKLKALGNGVVSQQCAEALRVMDSWAVAA